MNIIQKHWQQEKIIGINAIVFKNGHTTPIDIESISIKNAPQTFNKKYQITISKKITLENLTTDIWSEFQLYGQMILPDNSKILFGEGEMGNEGCIIKVDAYENFEWSLFSTESNPFIKAHKDNKLLHIFSTHGFSLVFNQAFNPLEIYIDNHFV